MIFSIICGGGGTTSTRTIFSRTSSTSGPEFAGMTTVSTIGDNGRSIVIGDNGRSMMIGADGRSTVTGTGTGTATTRLFLLSL